MAGNILEPGPRKDQKLPEKSENNMKFKQFSVMKICQHFWQTFYSRYVIILLNIYNFLYMNIVLYEYICVCMCVYVYVCVCVYINEILRWPVSGVGLRGTGRVATRCQRTIAFGAAPSARESFHICNQMHDIKLDRSNKG